MEYLLKHKNINVALVEIQDSNIIDIYAVYEKEHLPIKYEKEKLQTVYLLNRWLENRGIPDSRENYHDLLRYYGLDSLKPLTLLCYGLNLTDHWWLCNSGDDKRWEDVNFLQCDFSEKTGALLFSLQGRSVYANPDFSSNGHLIKMWKIIEGKRILLKGGSGDIRQEPYNECLASVIADRLDLDHVRYNFHTVGDTVYSGCECMINENTEFIDTFKVYLYNTEKTTNRYDDFVKICKNQGIQDVVEKLDRMLAFDFLIRNTDRNTGNYGILRDPETLKWLGIAPLFDHGDSLWNNVQNIKNIHNEGKSNCRSFEGTNEKNIFLIKNHGWYNGKELTDISDLAVTLLRKNGSMEDERIMNIADSLSVRNAWLEQVLSKVSI
jgi:hypothetical protein